MYSINMHVPQNRLEYYPTRGPHMLRQATAYLLSHATEEERMVLYDCNSVQPSRSVLFQKLDPEERTRCVFTKYMREYLKQHPEHTDEYDALYDYDAHQAVYLFFEAMEPKPAVVFLQNTSSDLLYKLDRLLGKRTNEHNGTVIYFDHQNMKQEYKLPNVNFATVYLGNEKLLYVCTKLTGPEQMTELLNYLYSEQNRLVLVVGEFGHDIDTEEYKYIEPLPILNSEFTTSREWSGFQPYPSLCNNGIKLKTSGALILMNQIGERLFESFAARISARLLDRSFFNGEQRLPNANHPLLNAILDIHIHRLDEPISPSPSA